MAILNRDFRKQESYLTKSWYKIVIASLNKPGAIHGITKNTYPNFLKCVTYIISFKVGTYINVFYLLL